MCTARTEDSVTANCPRKLRDKDWSIKLERTLIREAAGGLKRISVRDALPQAPCMSAAVHRGAAVGLP